MFPFPKHDESLLSQPEIMEEGFNWLMILDLPVGGRCSNFLMNSNVIAEGELHKIKHKQRKYFGIETSTNTFAFVKSHMKELNPRCELSTYILIVDLLVLTLVISMCLSNSYKLQLSVKHNNLLKKIFLWQHVSTLLSHHQAFQKNRSNVSKFIVHSGIP